MATDNRRRQQGVRIEGLISRKVIRCWLDNWESLQAGDSPPDAITGNSGPKARDGITGNMINRIMLEAAIADLPPVLKVCLEYRWIQQLPREAIYARTGIPKTTYYRRCNKAVDFIYYHVNGIAAGMKDLVDKIVTDTA